MDAETCRNEQSALRRALPLQALAAQDFIWRRYLSSSRVEPILQLRANLPTALSNLIAYTFAFRGNDSTFRLELLRLLDAFAGRSGCDS